VPVCGKRSSQHRAIISIVRSFLGQPCLDTCYASECPQSDLIACMIFRLLHLLNVARSHTQPWANMRVMQCKFLRRVRGVAAAAACLENAKFCLCLPLIRYGIKSVQVLAASASMIVQDCVEAEENVDARDKFFMYIVVSHISCRRKMNCAASLLNLRRQGGSPRV